MESIFLKFHFLLVVLICKKTGIKTDFNKIIISISIAIYINFSVVICVEFMCYLYKKAKIGINNIRQFNYEPFDRIDLYNNRYPKDNNYYVEKLQEINSIYEYGLNDIIKNKNIYLNILDEFDKSTKFSLIITFLLGIIVLCLQLVISLNYTDTLPLPITFFNFLCILFYFGISIYTLTRVTKLTSTKKQLANAEEYNKTLQIIHDSVRCFKHDFDNTVATLGGYIQTNDMEGLKNYYNQLENECEKVNNLYILNPEIINNPGIYSLLTNKYHKAEKQDVKLNISVLMDLNTINMKIYDFTKTLGILLDNSIDAASTCEEKIVNVIFREDDKNKRQLLIIENTYSDKNVDINKIFDKGITGKENHTGLGLWEIRKILKRNNNLNLYTTKNDKYFTQQFEIYNI